MTEKFIMCESNIPDGILHDQKLSGVSLKDDVLTLTFDTHLFSDDVGSEFCEKYKDFTKCHIKCKFVDKDYFCYVVLKSTPNKNNKFKAEYISFEDFVAFANKEIKKRNEKGYNHWTYLDTYVSPNINSAMINLNIWCKFKRTEYSSCTLELSTKEIEFIWE